MFPTSETFTKKVQELGLKNDRHIIVYTHHGAFSAARVWWTFRLFGIEHVSVLDGGFNAWKVAGGPIESGNISAAPMKGDMVGTINSEMIVTAKQVLQVVQNGSAQICDARSHLRFRGEVEEPRPGLISGHIPGSLNLPHLELLQLDDMTSYRSLDECKEIIDDAGIIPGAKVISSCGSGVTAATIAFTLYRLGWSLKDLAIYDGSWSEWGLETRPDLPKVS